MKWNVQIVPGAEKNSIGVARSMIYITKPRKLEKQEHIKTRKLWEEIFKEDTQEFLDYYYTVKTLENEIYVIEEDGTILRQDNDTKSELVAQNDIKNISTFSTVSEKLLENSSRPRITSIQTQEEAAQEEFILRKRMLAGEQIDFSQCNSLLDTVNDVELWEIIVKNHLSQPNRPPVDIINNYSSERAVEFMEMIYRIVSSCVATNSDWCQLPPEFLKNIIVFS